MKNAPIDRTDGATRTETGSKALLPALVAVGGGLAAMPAAALELSDVVVDSSLGQPLRASIAYALAPNEALGDTCVSVQRARPGTDLPTIGPATISVANGIISISGSTAVREPLMSMRVNVRCPYTPQLSRDYMLFVDPAQPATSIEPAVTSAAPAPVAVQPAPAPAVVRRRAANEDPIANATRYRVQPGDSLSMIAQRIENRPVGLWDAVATIFDANPDAFIDDDPNMLKAGSWLDIPDFGAGSPLTVADNKVFQSEPVTPADAVADQTGTAYDPAATEPVAATTATVETVDQFTDQVAAPDSGIADLQPGDVIIDSDNPFAATNQTVDIPETLIDAPEATSSSPNVPTAAVRTPEPEATSANWLLWLAGAGIAVIAALLFFGQGVRNRFGSAPVSAAAPKRRRTDTAHRIAVAAAPQIEVEEIEPLVDDEPVEPTVEEEVIEFASADEEPIADDSPTEENLALDADLVIGTGLRDGTDVDVAQDFGFAATTELDIELPEEMSSGVYDRPETDIIPPLNVDTESILESEVLPDTDDDEYDMSVIVDATKMPQPEDVTGHDLEAVQVPTGDDTLIAGDYTVSKEVDYRILEQDYEDELTATQVLNEEIQRAAEELANRMDEMDVAAAGGEDDTSEMSLASVTALDVTAQLPANNDDISDLDDTGINEAVTTVNMDSAEKTVEIDPVEKTVEIEAEDKTVEMPADDNTVEMPAKQGSK